MSKEEIENYKRKIEARYNLLVSKRVPLHGFVADTLPYPGKNGEVVFKRALALKREWSTEQWRHTVESRSKEDREDCQIVVIPPRDSKNKNKDFSGAMLKNLQKNQLGKHPVAYLERQPYLDDPYDRGRKVKGIKKVKTVYIVGSLVSEEDIADVQHVAMQYQLYGNDVEINLVSPFIKGERDDKSIELEKDSKRKTYTGKIVSIASTMQALSPYINNIFTYETHSSATQAFAAMFGMNLIPFSLYEELLNPIRKEITDPKEWRIVRPDVGRTMIAKRLGEILGMRGVSLSKFRKGDTLKSQSNTITDEERKALKGKNALLYDDEGATFGTVTDITINHLLKSGVKSINILLGHARLQKGWDENIEKMIEACEAANVPLKIYITDSRMPIGDLDSFRKKHKGVIRIVHIANKTRRIIEAAMDSVNFFNNNNWNHIDWERLILQAIPGYDSNGNGH